MLFGNPARLSPAISPDGRQLAWIAPDEDVLNVWVRDLDGAPGRLASLLWTRYRREYLYALEEHLGGLRDDGYE
ncbi:hypothetical protein, partial [Dactylosporangium sp. NPDC048998]|uniref:hypothetical protein n=1 Tax=Dactylosporangium sp. NPDC048998 TaxID=3363976 RepID=UPI003716D786